MHGPMYIKKVNLAYRIDTRGMRLIINKLLYTSIYGVNLGLTRLSRTRNVADNPI